jgi:UDP-GlcNAc3NAcA epimerase
MKKIITIIGARPQIIKASALSRAIRVGFKEKIEEKIVHTGQHYDTNMSDIFFEELGIPLPDFNLAVGSLGHGAQTAIMIEKLEEIFIAEKPDAVVVYGDTNSTLAAAIAASKIGISLIHIEAGLRSFNKAMPEEINRIMCDHVSTLLFTPTASGINNLKKEGFNLNCNSKATLDHPNVYHCGDIMYDNSLYFSEVADSKSTIIADLNLKSNGFILTTIHRNANTDDPQRLSDIIRALIDAVTTHNLTLVLPLHPRTQKMLPIQLDKELHAKLINNSNIKIIDPVGFFDIIALEKNSKLIVTDSGGLQKEAYFFGKPCVILREQTEWVEIVEVGNAVLVDANPSKIKMAIDEFLTNFEQPFPAIFGDGQAGTFICEKIVSDL